MDKLERIGAEIIAILSVPSGYKKNMYTGGINPTIIIESPKFIAELEKYYGNPEMFVQVLMNIHKYWKNELSPGVVNKMLRYHELMQEYVENEQKAQKKLMKLAEELPENQKANISELDELTDQLSDLMGSGSNSLYRKMNTLGVKKPSFKKPSSRKKDLTGSLVKSFNKKL